jgi:hypothetical protein
VYVFPLLVAVPPVREEVSGGISRVAVGGARVWGIPILLRVIGRGVQMWRWRYMRVGGSRRSSTTGTGGEQETTPVL